VFYYIRKKQKFLKREAIFFCQKGKKNLISCGIEYQKGLVFEPINFQSKVSKLETEGNEIRHTSTQENRKRDGLA